MWLLCNNEYWPLTKYFPIALVQDYHILSTDFGKHMKSDNSMDTIKKFVNLHSAGNKRTRNFIFWFTNRLQTLSIVPKRIGILQILEKKIDEFMKVLCGNLLLDS